MKNYEHFIMYFVTIGNLKIPVDFYIEISEDQNDSNKS